MNTATETFTAGDLEALITACRQVKKACGENMFATYCAAANAEMLSGQPDSPCSAHTILAFHNMLNHFCAGAATLEKREGKNVRNLGLNRKSAHGIHAWKEDLAALNMVLDPPKMSFSLQYNLMSHLPEYAQDAVITPSASIERHGGPIQNIMLEDLEWFKQAQTYLAPVVKALEPKINNLQGYDLLLAAATLSASQKETGDFFEGKPYHFTDRARMTATKWATSVARLADATTRMFP